jgi:hypothetical protein
MKGPVYKELRALKKSGGDLYQKYADKHGMTREEAKAFLFPFLYGAGISTITPILTEGEAISTLDQFNKLYGRAVQSLELTTLKGETHELYVRVNGRLVKVPSQDDR